MKVLKNLVQHYQFTEIDDKTLVKEIKTYECTTEEEALQIVEEAKIKYLVSNYNIKFCEKKDDEFYRLKITILV